MSKPKPSKPEAQKQDLEQLGQMLVSIYESGYIDRNQAYKMSFVKGLVGGLGGVIGATLVVGLLLWTLSLLKEVPFVGPLTRSVRTTIQDRPGRP